MGKIEAEFVGEMREAVSELKSDARESRKVVNETKDTLIRVETLMENVVTKPVLLKAIIEHKEKDHKPQRSSAKNYTFWGGVATGFVLLVFAVFKLASMGLL